VTPAELNAAWVRQAQLDADRGLVECRVCKATGDLARAVTLWINGALLFAVCERCRAEHEIVMRPTERGIEIKARTRAPLVVGPR
jgi:hypothetical protein